MKPTMTTTAVVVTALIIIAGIYDAVMCLFFGLQYSISQLMVDLGFRAPFIPFVIGVICGHLFSYMRQSE